MRPEGRHNPTTKRTQIAPPIKILVVDDDSKDLQDYSRTIQQEGYEVRACATYAEALRCMEADVFAFILVSQGSGRFEGRSVLERAIETDRHTPVVVLARCLDMACYIDAMHLGALDYFEKPLAPAEIVLLVKNHSRPRSVGG